jgi:hypothetical protein
MAQAPAIGTIAEAAPRTQNISIPQLSAQGIPGSAVPLSKGIRSGHLNLDTFSPVNQNGSFEFDRVLKTGTLQKRTKKTKVREQLQTSTSLLTKASELETRLPGAPAESPLYLQERAGIEASKSNQPFRTHGCSLAER